MDISNNSKDSTTSPDIDEPFPIFVVAKRHVLYDIKTISYIRRKYHITGVLIGGLPQAPQQNVFLGIPLELMPEEARLLVEKGVAYLVDDVAQHKHAFVEHNLGADEKKAFLSSIKKQGVDATKVQQKAAADRKKEAIKKMHGDWNDIPEDMLSAPSSSSTKSRRAKKTRAQPVASHSAQGQDDRGQDDVLFGGNAQHPTPAIPSAPSVDGLGNEQVLKITPTTSHPPLRTAPPAAPSSAPPLPPATKSYPLFKHMHDNDYFLAPGLRFGCQYMAYPGDPLRFHSHFLCSGMAWDQEFDLLDIVGGGRLGTGVKKAYLVGGEQVNDDDAAAAAAAAAADDRDGKVRAFCIEWGGM